VVQAAAAKPSLHICTNKTCRRQGAPQVQQHTIAADSALTDNGSSSATLWPQALIVGLHLASPTTLV
jgi:hypothetical protein